MSNAAVEWFLLFQKRTPDVFTTSLARRRTRGQIEVFHFYICLCYTSHSCLVFKGAVCSLITAVALVGGRSNITLYSTSIISVVNLDLLFVCTQDLYEHRQYAIDMQQSSLKVSFYPSSSLEPPSASAIVIHISAANRIEYTAYNRATTKNSFLLVVSCTKDSVMYRLIGK